MPDLAPSDIERRSKLSELVAQRRRAYRTKIDELEEAKAAKKLAQSEFEGAVMQLASLVDDQQAGRLRLLQLDIEQ